MAWQNNFLVSFNYSEVGIPEPPAGFAALIDDDGNVLTDDDGNILIASIA